MEKKVAAISITANILNSDSDDDENGLLLNLVMSKKKPTCIKKYELVIESYSLDGKNFVTYCCM